MEFALVSGKAFVILDFSEALYYSAVDQAGSDWHFLSQTVFWLQLNGLQITIRKSIDDLCVGLTSLEQWPQREGKKSAGRKRATEQIKS